MPTLRSSSNPIGVTLGDPGGIGPEVTAKALKNAPSVGKITLIGDRAVYARYAKKIPGTTEFIDVQSGFDKSSVGKKSRAGAEASLKYLQTAVELLKTKKIRALVTAPVCKETITAIKPDFQGHTEFLAENFHFKNVEMMFVAERMRVVILTRHIPLARVFAEITPEKVYRTIQLTDRSLKTLFKIKRPRIAVCGINPHAGENGTLGTEDREKILPAVERSRRDDILAEGPLAADTLFTPAHIKKYDCVLAMYHDQGLTPIKTLYFRQCVNLTIGLPFIRTSPAHGTAFDIAGKNQADPGSMIAAIKLAAKLSAKK